MKKIVIVFGILMAGSAAMAQMNSSVVSTASAVAGVSNAKADVAINTEMVKRFNTCEFVESPMSWDNIRQALEQDDAIAYVNTLREKEVRTSNFDEVQMATLITAAPLVARKNNLDLRDMK